MSTCFVGTRGVMRQYGILLPISSLPSAYGIGDLGPAAHSFARTLAQAGAKVWQILPLVPTSCFIGNSPYSSLSAFAGNPLYISPEGLVAKGFLAKADLEASLGCLPEGCVLQEGKTNYAACTVHREHLLLGAFERNRHILPTLPAFITFCRSQEYWLHDYARFVTIKAEHGGSAWTDWSEPLRNRNPKALEAWDSYAAVAMLREKFIQYVFFSQWEELRQTCRSVGVEILGDVPIYVTADSADVWAAPQYFNLDEAMHPVTVAGVPPDYFSPTGQRWGNPVYRWDVLAAEDFAWWKRRIAHSLTLMDAVRLDHFRGFCAYWEFPASDATAEHGYWVPAPAKAFFTSLQKHFGSLPFIAEDLGIITDDVREIMGHFGLAGMHVLHFAFGGEKFWQNGAIPHNHTANSVVYTGTHDNAPTRQWFEDLEFPERALVMAYAGNTGLAPVRALARLALSSVASLAVLPMQDVLELGAEGRMNVPGQAEGNWEWRLNPAQAGLAHFAWVQELARLYGRVQRD